MRRISACFIIVFVIEISVFMFVLYWSYGMTMSNQLEQARTVSSTLAALGSILVTTGLVYHSFLQHSELRLMGVIVEPLDSQLQPLAQEEYRSSLFVRDPTAPGGYYRLDQTRPKMKDGFQEVKSTSQFSKIRVSMDVSNIGINETTIHEYVVTEKKPIAKLVGVYFQRESLPHQKRTTLDFNYPEQPAVSLKGGNYEFEIAVISSTERKLRRAVIIASDDLKTVRWKEIDC